MAELVAACHCGRATIRLPRKPDYVNHCNCSLCAALGWQGIYFASDELVIEGAFDSYVRSDMAQPTLQVLRCATCGTATHWTPLGEPPYERMGVNARLVDPALLEGVEVRAIDGRSWDTGIGCYFDDPVHAAFGIVSREWQSFYHFTVGGPVEDRRLTTLPAYNFGDRQALGQA